MAAIKQLAKLRTGNLDTDRAVAHIADTLNPLLRTLPIPADFRFAEVAGLNGAAPTFQLQYKANNAQGWAGIATFTSAGAIVPQAVQLVGAAGQPAFQNSWVNYGAGFLPAGFYKDPFGIVHLRGTISNAPGVAASTVIYTLPAGYRPSAKMVCDAQNLTTAAGAYARVDIDTGGNLIVGAIVAAGSVYNLDNIHFLGEQ